MKIDAKLVERAQKGDQAAITEIYNLTYKSAYGVARQIVGNDDDACDILQDSYIAAFTKLNTLKEPEKFYGWFKRIVSNRCCNYLKKKKPELFSQRVEKDEDGEEIEIQYIDESETFSPDAALDYEETKRLLREIIDSLPKEQSLCVLMYYVQDMSIAEIAETLGVSQNTVKSRLNYGRKKIKDEVEVLEKKGTKLYGISGLALIPFLRWMFTEGTTSTAPNLLSNILSSADKVVTVADTVDKASAAIEAADTVSKVADATDTASVGTTVVKKLGKKLALKIGAGVATAAITATGVATVATMNNTVEADDYIQEVIYCEGYDGYGAFPDLDSVINVAELEKALFGDSIDEYYAYCESANISIEDCIDVDVNMLQDGELSNGDTVEFTVSIDYEAINTMDGIENSFKGEPSYTFKCTVQGLKELSQIDLFSIFKSIGIDTTTGSDCLEIEYFDEAFEKDFGTCRITWKEESYGSLWGELEYALENGEKEAETFYIKFEYPDGRDYISGDKITMTVERLGEGDYRNYGFVIAPLEKEIEPDRVFNVMKSDNISDESFNILKNKATEIAGRDIAGGVTFAGSFVAVDTAQTDISTFVMVYENNSTGNFYAYEYKNPLIDQNGDILKPDELSPNAVEFYPDILSWTSYLESYEEVVNDYKDDDEVLIFEINKK